MKLPRSLTERLKWAGPYRIAAVCVFTVVSGKWLWDSYFYLQGIWGSKLTLESRRLRFDPSRVTTREPRE
eukprot:symbB.v1.2.039817.t1/scaffold6805.1/size15415/1